MNRSNIGKLLIGGKKKSQGGSTATKLSLGASEAVRSKSPGNSLSRGATLASKKGRAAEELANGASLATRRLKKGGYIDKEGYIINDTSDGSLRRARTEKRNDQLSGLRLKKGGSLWIQDAVSRNKGALHRDLHVSPHKKIPLSKLHKAEHSKSPTIRKRAQLAETLRGFNHRPRGR